MLARVLAEQVPPSDALTDLTAQLKAINESLWKIEDDIRDLERARDFGPAFIENARAVYVTNDQPRRREAPDQRVAGQRDRRGKILRRL